jgi:hypothetical protein
MGFHACLADPDVWMRPAVKPDGTKYWEYVLVYVDDLLAVSHNPGIIMEQLREHYTLKAGSVRPPAEYLGSDIKEFIIPTVNGENTESCWSMSANTYVKRDVADVVRTLDEVGQRLKTRVTTPMATGYRPELDAIPGLDERKTNYFQGLIGILQWIVELGRVDIMVAVAMLSRFLASPREGHLEQAFHIFAYLKAHYRSCLAFSACPSLVDEIAFHSFDWTKYYPDAAEAAPTSMPEPRGKSVITTCFVDADHAGCRVTRRSQTGILIFVRRSPLLWYSKRQNTVETSTFGSEFIAMKVVAEQLEALRYKLRMMGVPVEGPTNVYCNNESVFKSTVFPEYTFQKKHNSIAYHKTREAQAAGTVRIAWIPSEKNLSDVLTKLFPGPTLKELCRQFMW